jgi:hypothetical protein
LQFSLQAASPETFGYTLLYYNHCECCKGLTYVGQTGRNIETRCKGHIRHIRHGHPEKCAVVEHSMKAGHRIDFSNVSLLGKVTVYRESIVNEATEMSLHPNDFRRDAGFTFRQAWYSVSHMLKHSQMKQQ